MLLMVGDWGVVVGLGPPRLSDGMPGPLVKGLPHKLGTGPAEVNPLALAATPPYRCNPAGGLQLAGAAKTLPLGSQSGDHPWCHHLAASRQRIDDGQIVMYARSCHNLSANHVSVHTRH